MAVVNGQPGNEDTFNNAFGSKQRANTYTGIQSYAHTGSGNSITNIQQLVNDIMTSLGFSSEDDANKDVYDSVASNLYAIANGQNRKVAIKNLDAAMALLDGRVETLEGNVPASNLSATADPTAADDVDAGWLPGSGWLNTTNNNYFICTDNTATAAVWVGIGNKDEVQANAFYMGDPSTDGTWRIVPSGTDLNFELREAGVWVWKQKITP